MSAAGHSMLTSSQCAPHSLLPNKHQISVQAAPRHIVAARASVACKVSTSSNYRWGDVLASSSQPSSHQVANIQQAGACSYASERESVQSLQQRLPILYDSMAVADMTQAFLAGATAVAASGQLQRSGYDWAEAMLVTMAWQQALAAQQTPAADKGLLTKYCNPAVTGSMGVRTAEEGLEEAKQKLKGKADDFSWRLLNVLNANGYEPGLAFEQLPVQLQLFAYRLLLKCGCVGTWGQAIYRELPPIAATIRPGNIVAIPLQQYLSIAQHIPTICRDEMDGTWWGEAQIRLDPFQVISAQEVAKALAPDMLPELLKSGSGYAADLAAVAAKLGLIDGATATTWISSNRRSLAETLLLRMSKAFLGIHAAAIVSMRRPQQQASSNSATSAVAVASSPDGIFNCLTCDVGGAGGSRRGSITAVGSGDYDAGEAGAGLVAICKGGQDVQTSTVTTKVDDDCSRRGLLQRTKALFRSFFKH